MKGVEEKPQKLNKLTPFCNLDHFITVEKKSVVEKLDRFIAAGILFSLMKCCNINRVSLFTPEVHYRIDSRLMEGKEQRKQKQ